MSRKSEEYSGGSAVCVNSHSFVIPTMSVAKRNLLLAESFVVLFRKADSSHKKRASE
jgi:hypothetical protein